MLGRATKFVFIASALAVAVSGTMAFGVNPSDGQVNAGGATLFRDWFPHASGTNDFIDVDLNQTFGFNAANLPLAEQLATKAWAGANPNQSVWWFCYKASGSGTGLQDLRYYFNGIAAPRSSGPTPDSPYSVSQPANWNSYAVPSDSSCINGNIYYTSGGPAGFAGAFPGGMPYQVDSVDIAVMDVPTLMMLEDWTANSVGTTWQATPGTAGYGRNKIPSPVYGQKSNLKDLAPLNLGANGPAPLWNHAVDGLTAFDTPLAWAAIAFVANPGTGLQNVKMSDLQYMYVTGRAPSGENFQVCSREPGSGTKNASMNSIGVDPSWGPGDRFGLQTPASATDLTLVGAAHQPSYLAGTSVMKAVVTNTRLAVGYVGAVGDSNGMVSGGQAEVLNVAKDIDSSWDGHSYVRPNLTSVLQNGNVNTGWQVGGLETMITVGDPRATINPTYAISSATAPNTFTLAAGSYQGLLYTGDKITVVGTNNNNGTFTVVSESYDPTHTSPTVTVQEAVANDVAGGTLQLVNTNPVMSKLAAAKYILNIESSLQNFIHNPTATSDQLMPGEDLALTFIVRPAVDNLPTPAAPAVFGANPTEVPSVQAYVLANNTWNMPAFGGAAAGKVPQRVASPDYAYAGDGSTNGNYTEVNGNVLVSGAAGLNTRNQLAMDFNNDGSRNINDIFDPANPGKVSLMEALVKPASLPSSDLCPQIIGDVNSDGDFDQEDARYAADGLAIDPATGLLNRNKGFTLVDQGSQQWGGALNYFGTTLVTGKPYTAGASRGDVTENPSVGFTYPITASVRGAGNSHRSTFTVTGDARYLHRGKRVTVSGNANNGVFSVVGVTFAAGSSTIEVFEDLANAGAAGGNLVYAPYNQIGAQPTADGVVDKYDVRYIKAQITLAAKQAASQGFASVPAFGSGATAAAKAKSLSVYANVDLSADMTGDMVVDMNDLHDIIENVLGTHFGDVNLDGHVNVVDLQALVAAWGTNSTNSNWTTSGYVDCDINNDGYVNVGDLQSMVANWGL